MFFLPHPPNSLFGGGYLILVSKLKGETLGLFIFLILKDLGGFRFFPFGLGHVFKTFFPKNFSFTANPRARNMWRILYDFLGRLMFAAGLTVGNILLVFVLNFVGFFLFI